MTQQYDTVVAALEGLKQRGFTTDFNVAFDQLHCSEKKIRLNPEDFEIVEIHRFEGDTNPEDEDIVYAINSKDGTVKGTLTGAFGAYGELSDEMIKKLTLHLS